MSAPSQCTPNACTVTARLKGRGKGPPARHLIGTPSHGGVSAMRPCRRRLEGTLKLGLPDSGLGLLRGWKLQDGGFVAEFHHMASILPVGEPPGCQDGQPCVLAPPAGRSAHSWARIPQTRQEGRKEPDLTAHLPVSTPPRHLQDLLGSALHRSTLGPIGQQWVITMHSACPGCWFRNNRQSWQGLWICPSAPFTL